MAEQRRRFEALVHGIEELSVGFNILVVFAMMLLVVFGVVMRYVFNAPVSTVAAISAYMMVALTFLSLAFVQRVRRHVAVAFFVIKRRERTQWLLGLLITVLCLIVFVLIAWSGWKYAYQAWQFNFRSEEGNLPIFPARVLVPIGAGLMCLRLVADLIRGIRSKELLGPTEETGLEEDL